MIEKSYCEDRITKTGEFSLRTTKKFESSNKINRDSKKRHCHISNPKTCPALIQHQIPIVI